jgi:hypothetical protein
MANSKKFHEGALEGKARHPDQSGEAPKGRTGDIEVPPKDWESFLESFSLQHEGWLASVSVGHGTKSSMVASKCRLQSVSIDCTEKFCVNISVLAGGKRQIHSVPEPSLLTFKRDIDGAHQGLQIASADGSVTFLEFRAAALSESLDGILPSLNCCVLNVPLPEFCGRGASA